MKKAPNKCTLAEKEYHRRRNTCPRS